MMTKHSIDMELKMSQRQNGELLSANIKLADELKWAKEDKERTQKRIDRAMAYLNAEKITNNDLVREALDKYESVMRDILENDFYE